MKRLSKFLYCCVAFIHFGALAAAVPAWQDCPLDRAVYRDAGQRGFILEFSKSGESPDLASTLARVTVLHCELLPMK